MFPLHPSAGTTSLKDNLLQGFNLTTVQTVYSTAIEQSNAPCKAMKSHENDTPIILLNQMGCGNQTPCSEQMARLHIQCLSFLTQSPLG